MPNVCETSLDLTVSEQLSNHSAPVRLQSGWMVRLETHYLGGGRHFGSWEIADIGFLVKFRRAGRLVRSKVALLQSKRLYPREVDFEEDKAIDYLVGFGRLLESDETYLANAKPRKFRFDELSRYKALPKGDDQYDRIEEFEQRNQVPVFYMLYHPLRVPSSVDVPRTSTRNPRGPNKAGCRVVGSKSVRVALQSFHIGYMPRFGDMRVRLPVPHNSPEHETGWRLEHFVARVLVTSKDKVYCAGKKRSRVSIRASIFVLDRFPQQLESTFDSQ